MIETEIEQIVPPSLEGPLISKCVHIDNPHSLLQEELISGYGLSKLIVEGYAVTEMDEVEEQLGIEYGEATDVILALDQNGKAIGSLALRRLMIEEAPAVSTFVDQVDSVFPEKKGRPILHINGIVVEQLHRNRSVGVAMMRQAIELMKPSLIVGETKTPEVVAIRSKLGQSFFGYKPIGNAPGPDAGMRSVIDGYVEVNRELLGTLWRNKADDYSTSGVFYVSHKYLPTTVPNPRDDMQDIFHDVCELQKSENAQGTNRTAVAPIITIIE